jgi:ribonuclease P protein component
MFDAENASMDSALDSAREQAAQSSSGGAARGASAFPPRSLKGKRRFAEVFATGTRHRRGGITVIVSRDGRAPEVGIIASKKRVGPAVARNKARRRIRAALGRVTLPEGSYIVVASRAVLTAPFERLVGWLETAMKEKRD